MIYTHDIPLKNDALELSFTREEVLLGMRARPRTNIIQTPHAHKYTHTNAHRYIPHTHRHAHARANTHKRTAHAHNLSPSRTPSLLCSCVYCAYCTPDQMLHYIVSITIYSRLQVCASNIVPLFGLDSHTRKHTSYLNYDD